MSNKANYMIKMKDKTNFSQKSLPMFAFRDGGGGVEQISPLTVDGSASI